MRLAKNAGISIVQMLVALVFVTGVVYVLTHSLTQSYQNQMSLAWKNEVNVIRNNLLNGIDCTRTFGSSVTCPSTLTQIYLLSDTGNDPTYANGPKFRMSSSGDGTGNWYIQAACTANTMNVTIARLNAQGIPVKDPMLGAIYGNPAAPGDPWPSLFQRVQAPCAATITAKTQAGGLPPLKLMQTVSRNVGFSTSTSGGGAQNLGAIDVQAKGNFQLVSVQGLLGVATAGHTAMLGLVVTDQNGGVAYDGYVIQKLGTSNTVWNSSVFSETAVATTPGLTYSYQVNLAGSGGGTSVVTNPVNIIVRDYYK